MSRHIVPKPDVGQIMREIWGDRLAAPEPPTEIRICIGRQGAGRCTAQVIDQLGSMHFCDQHLKEVVAAVRERPEAGEGFHVLAKSVVYYIGDPAVSQVKIGVTTRMRSRFMQLSTARRKVILLATEPGDISLERRRHREFRALCVSGEWFRKTPLLMEHVGQVRIEHGILLTGDGALPPWAVAPLRSTPAKTRKQTPDSRVNHHERTAP